MTEIAHLPRLPCRRNMRRYRGASVDRRAILAGGACLANNSQSPGITPLP